MKNLIKPTPQTVKREIFHFRRRFNVRVPASDFFLRQILSEISNFIINSVIKLAGEKPAPEVKYDSLRMAVSSGVFQECH